MSESGKNLGNRVAKGALWLSGAKFFARLITTIRLIILAALLPQDQIGLFGLAAVVMQLLETLSQTGMQTALIQRKNSVQEYLGTAWVIQAIRGVVLSIIILLLAESFEAFFDKTGVANLLHILAFVPICFGVQNIGLVLLHRELRFGKVAGIQAGSAFVDLALSLLIALQFPTAIALVWGRVGCAIFTAVASFALERRWAKLNFSISKLQELFSFGIWVFISALLSFALVRGGHIIIGKLLTIEDLAVYQIAFALACGPIMEIMTVIGGTALPAYSQLQTQNERLSSAFLRVLASTSFLASLSLVGFTIFAVDFTALFFRPEYQVMATLLPPLAVWGACRGLGATNSVLFQGIGKPALATVFQFFMLILFLTFLIPLSIRYGIMGIVYALAGIGLSAQALRYFLIVRILKIPGREIFQRLAIPLGIGTLSGMTAWLAMSTIDPDYHALRLVLGGCVLLPMFVSLSYKLDGVFKFGLRAFLQSIIPNRFAFVLGRN